MDKDLQNKAQFREKLRNTFRLIIMNDETLEETHSYRLSLLNVYTVLSIILVLLSLLIISFIIFTPIKRFIPGYGDVNRNPQFLELKEKVDLLEEELDNQELYIDGLTNLFDGVEEDKGTITAKISNTENTVKSSIQEAPNISSNLLDELFFINPVNGTISEGFMIDKKHFGVDILAPKNTPIKSILDGVILSSDWSLETGNTISIQHASNIISVYKHNSVLLKETGSLVKAGEAIAIIGNTGTLSDGPHLHFELWYNGKPENPEEYFSF